MKKETLITLLCAILMLVTPFTTVAKESKINNNKIEQPGIDELVAQLCIVIDDILEKYGHIPMVSNLCNAILSLSNIIGKIIYCIVFGIVIFLLLAFAKLMILIGLGDTMFCKALLLFTIALTIGFSDECLPDIPFPKLFLNLSLNQIYTLSQTKDITNLAKDCPCLQE